MPGLLRGIARTAAIAGTATAVGGRVQRRQAARFASRDANTEIERDQAYAEQAPPVAPAPAPAPAPTRAGGEDMIEQLKGLGELRDQGILTEAEFAVQKARVLGS